MHPLPLPPPLLVVFLGGLSLVACGTQQNGEIPPELLSAIAQGKDGSQDYPTGPMGGQVGDVAENRCIQAWNNPKAANFDAAQLKTLCLGDFWDPAAEDHKLLLVNTAAIWCQVCQVEYAGSGLRGPLGQEVGQRSAAGLRVLGSLFQDGQFNPATAKHAATWAETFEVDFPFGLDASFELGAFASADVQPLNMVIDTQTMKILLKTQDAEAAWLLIDSRLGL